MLLTFAFVIFINNWQNKRENRHSTVSQPVSHSYKGKDSNWTQTEVQTKKEGKANRQ